MSNIMKQNADQRAHPFNKPDLAFLPAGETPHIVPPDGALVRRARNGDDAAFRRLVERYEEQIASTVIGMMGEGPDAEEIGQRVFVKFYEALDDFRGDAALGTYLTRIAMNLCLNEKRRQKRWYRRFISRDGAMDLPEPAYEDDASFDMKELLRRALEHLSDKHRAVVVLRLIEGRSTRETAEILEVAEGTVLSRLARARSALKEMLSPYLEDERHGAI